MLRLVLIFVFCTVFSTAQAEAPAGKWGLGLMLGTPTAISGKYWMSQKNSFDLNLGFGPSNWTMFFGDFHWNFPGIFGSSNRFWSQVIGYVGLGGGFSIWSSGPYCNRWYCDNNRSSGTAIFIRGPFGAEWSPGSPSLGVFVELAPFITLSPATSSSLDAAIGARYYF